MAWPARRPVAEPPPAPTGHLMSSPQQHPALQSYVAELARLHTLTPDGLAQEVDERVPLWVSLRVVPEL
ncbi:hypothetical protein NOCARDAX2BIS_140075 [Nocardioides sp. AX2bis]|nr:hypothetical protein NOCARDAX2BIS_140075 [Nocardioides sp. AX2bis]